jgi:hypothetical protein
MQFNRRKTMIDFDQVLCNPRGIAFTEPKFDENGKPSGVEEITLGALCYTVLTLPQNDEKVSVVESARIAKLASAVLTGEVDLRVEQKTLLLRRMDAAPLSAIVKAAVLKVVDPAAYDQA